MKREKNESPAYPLLFLENNILRLFEIFYYRIPSLLKSY